MTFFEVEVKNNNDRRLNLLHVDLAVNIKEMPLALHAFSYVMMLTCL